jgi:hypothetical protein
MGGVSYARTCLGAPNAGVQPRRTALNEGARFAWLEPAQTIKADLCFVFSKMFF